MIRRLLADERVRFLIVGGVNTVLAYALFVLFYWTLGGVIGHLGSLALAYLLATLVAFVLHRRFTFRASGPILRDFLRFESVYVVMFVLNAAGLALLVDVAGWLPYVAQAVLVVITTVTSYLGHKWFSFRRPAATAGQNARHSQPRVRMTTDDHSRLRTDHRD